MQIMDSPSRYGAISRFLHWSVAALIIWQLVSMALKDTLGREYGFVAFMAGSHSSVGYLAFVMVWLRLFWALMNRSHRPGHAGALGMAAKLGHMALYGLMLFVPTVAVLRALGGERPVSVFGVQIFAGRPEGQEVEALTSMGNLHGEMAWLLAALIAGHVIMALFHSAVLKDRTIAKMA